MGCLAPKNFVVVVVRGKLNARKQRTRLTLVVISSDQQHIFLIGYSVRDNNANQKQSQMKTSFIGPYFFSLTQLMTTYRLFETKKNS